MVALVDSGMEMLHNLHGPCVDDFVLDHILEAAGISDIVLQLLEYLLGPSQAVWIVVFGIMLPETRRRTHDQLIRGEKALIHSILFLRLRLAVFIL